MDIRERVIDALREWHYDIREHYLTTTTRGKGYESADVVADRLLSLMGEARTTPNDCIGHNFLTLCVACGPNVLVDEDGCCVDCGANAMGDWLLNSWRDLPVLPSEARND